MRSHDTERSSAQGGQARFAGALPGQTSQANASRDAFSGYLKGLQRKPLPGAPGAAGAAADRAPGAIRGGGAPLPAAFQARMESAFGQDFSGVRVHEDAGAVGAVGAQAFAQGEQIVLGPGQAGNEKLLMHELTHVVQQRGGRVPAGAPQGKGGAVVVDAALETEADAVAERVSAGGKAEVAGGGAPTRGAAPIQGYHIRENGQDGWTGLPGKSRVSEDNAMAVLDTPPPGPKGVANPKVFLATDEMLKAAQDALASNGSPYTLTSDGVVAHGPDEQALHAVRMHNGDEHGSETTPKNCDENMRTGLGVVRPKDKDAPRRMGAMIGGELKPLRGAENATATANKVRKEISEGDGKGDSTDRKELNKRYGEMDPGLRNEGAKEQGVNQYATPQSGDGLGVLGENGVGHFAHVLVTGPEGDYVTLENDAAQSGPQSKNPNWYFRMYGSVKTTEGGEEDVSQTFWGEQGATGDYETMPIVLTIRGRDADMDDGRVEAMDAFRTEVSKHIRRIHGFDKAASELTAKGAADCLEVWIELLEREALKAPPKKKKLARKATNETAKRNFDIEQRGVATSLEKLKALRPMAQSIVERFGKPVPVQPPIYDVNKKGKQDLGASSSDDD